MTGTTLTTPLRGTGVRTRVVALAIGGAVVAGIGLWVAITAGDDASSTVDIRSGEAPATADPATATPEGTGAAEPAGAPGDPAADHATPGAATADAATPGATGASTGEPTAEEYWTDERMAEAQPKPMPTPGPADPATAPPAGGGSGSGGGGTSGGQAPSNP